MERMAGLEDKSWGSWVMDRGVRGFTGNHTKVDVLDWNSLRFVRVKEESEYSRKDIEMVKMINSPPTMKQSGGNIKDFKDSLFQWVKDVVSVGYEYEKIKNVIGSKCFNDDNQKFSHYKQIYNSHLGDGDVITILHSWDRRVSLRDKTLAGTVERKLPFVRRNHNQCHLQFLHNLQYFFQREGVDARTESNRVEVAIRGLMCHSNVLVVVRGKMGDSSMLELMSAVEACELRDRNRYKNDDSLFTPNKGEQDELQFLINLVDHSTPSISGPTIPKHTGGLYFNKDTKPSNTKGTKSEEPSASSTDPPSSRDCRHGDSCGFMIKYGKCTFNHSREQKERLLKLHKEKGFQKGGKSGMSDVGKGNEE